MGIENKHLLWEERAGWEGITPGQLTGEMVGFGWKE